MSDLIPASAGMTKSELIRVSLKIRHNYILTLHDAILRHKSCRNLEHMLRILAWIKTPWIGVGGDVLSNSDEFKTAVKPKNIDCKSHILHPNAISILLVVDEQHAMLRC